MTWKRSSSMLSSSNPAISDDSPNRNTCGRPSGTPAASSSNAWSADSSSCSASSTSKYTSCPVSASCTTLDKIAWTSGWATSSDCATWPSTLAASLAPRAETTTLCTDCLLVLATRAWRSRVLPLPSGPVTTSINWL
ncbi:hypothetical protein D3C76_922940 [compost metagenome]